MKVVYLGLISKVFNAVFDAILAPVFKFISSLLETALGWVFNEVLGPIIINVLDPLFKGLIRLVMDILGAFIYSLFSSCLSLVDSLQQMFNIFAGLSPVTYTNGTEKITGPILDVIFSISFIQKIAWVLIAVSFVLMMMFAIIATARSVLDTGDEIQKPVSKVLSLTFRSMVKMFLVPICVFFAITMAGRILASIDMAFTEATYKTSSETSKVQEGTKPTLSRMVFVISSMDASNTAKYNISGKVKENDTPVDIAPDIGINDSVRKPYYTGVKSYSDKKAVENDFDFSRFDYLIGFGGCVFLIIVLGICLINFITRIFEVIILFLTAPLFASAMPLDDGEKFKSWQDLFVGKLFGGYGTVIAMQLYLILCPAIMGGGISFGKESNALADYLIRFIFLLGGAWATVKAGPTITQLINYQAGQAEMQNSRDVTSGMMATASFVANSAGTLARKAGQQYRGWKQDRARADALKNKKMADSDKRIASKLNPAGTGRNSAGTPQGGARPGAPKFNQNGKPKKPPAVLPKNAPRQTGSFLNGRFTMNTTASGKSYLGFNFGKFARLGRDEQGRFRANFLGFKYREGVDGKAEKINAFSFLKFKQTDEGMKLAKVSMPGWKFKRAETVTKDADGNEHRELGDFYCSKFSPTGLKRKFDQDTGRVEKLSSFGTHYAKDANGDYTMTHRNILGRRIEYERDGQGGYRKTHVSGKLHETSYSYDADGTRRIESIQSAGKYGTDNYFYQRSEGESTRAAQERSAPPASSGLHESSSGNSYSGTSSHTPGASNTVSGTHSAGAGNTSPARSAFDSIAPAYPENRSIDDADPGFASHARSVMQEAQNRSSGNESGGQRREVPNSYRTTPEERRQNNNSSGSGNNKPPRRK